MLSLCILSFLISQWSVRWGSKWHNKSLHNNFWAWMWDLSLGIGFALGGCLCNWGWELCSCFLSILAWLFFLHPVFVLEKNGVKSHFLPSWLLSLLLSCFLFVITIKVNIKTDYYIFNWKNIWAQWNYFVVSCLRYHIQQMSVSKISSSIARPCSVMYLFGRNWYLP